MKKIKLDLKRPSPAKSATLYTAGAKKAGNDGRMWIVVVSKNGVKRWDRAERHMKSFKNKKKSKAHKKLIPKTRGLAYQREALNWIQANKGLFKKLVFNAYAAPSKTSNRVQLAKDLTEIVTAWQAITGRNQDMPDDRIATLSRQELKQSIAWYVSKEGLAALVPYLGDILLLAD